MLNYSTILPQTKQLLVALSQNQVLQEMNFALAGGTNLALRLGHRHSVDLDFFVNEPFDKESLEQEIQAGWPNAIKANETKQSLQYRIEGVKVEFLLHKYTLIDKIEKQDNILLYSIVDVAAMKLNALNNRGAKKDFWDIAALLKLYSLEELFMFFGRKYPNTDKASLLRSLVYFDDAEMEPDPLDTDTNWQNVKQTIETTWRKYVQNLF